MSNVRWGNMFDGCGSITGYSNPCENLTADPVLVAAMRAVSSNPEQTASNRIAPKGKGGRGI